MNIQEPSVSCVKKGSARLLVGNRGFDGNSFLVTIRCHFFAWLRKEGRAPRSLVDEIGFAADDFL